MQCRRRAAACRCRSWADGQGRSVSYPILLAVSSAILPPRCRSPRDHLPAPPIIRYHMIWCHKNSEDGPMAETLVCRDGDIAEGGVRIVRAGKLEIGVIRHAGKYYAYRNHC